MALSSLRVLVISGKQAFPNYEAHTYICFVLFHVGLLLRDKVRVVYDDGVPSVKIVTFGFGSLPQERVRGRFMAEITA